MGRSGHQGHAPRQTSRKGPPPTAAPAPGSPGPWRCARVGTKAPLLPRALGCSLSAVSGSAVQLSGSSGGRALAGAEAWGPSCLCLGWVTALCRPGGTCWLVRRQLCPPGTLGLGHTAPSSAPRFPVTGPCALPPALWNPGPTTSAAQCPVTVTVTLPATAASAVLAGLRACPAHCVSCRRTCPGGGGRSRPGQHS